jgi:hypothetical protein
MIVQKRVGALTERVFRLNVYKFARSLACLVMLLDWVLAVRRTFREFFAFIKSKVLFHQDRQRNDGRCLCRRGCGPTHDLGISDQGGGLRSALQVRREYMGKDQAEASKMSSEAGSLVIAMIGERRVSTTSATQVG